MERAVKFPYYLRSPFPKYAISEKYIQVVKRFNRTKSCNHSIRRILLFFFSTNYNIYLNLGLLFSILIIISFAPVILSTPIFSTKPYLRSIYLFSQTSKYLNPKARKLLSNINTTQIHMPLR